MAEPLPPDSTGAPGLAAMAISPTGTRGRRGLTLALQVAVFAILVGGWQVLADTGLIDEFFFSRPSDIAAQTWRLLASAFICPHLAVTPPVSMMAFVIGTVPVLAAGLAFALLALLPRVFHPY